MIQNSIPIKYGLLAGTGIVAYFLLFYVVDPRLLFNPWVYWASLGVYLALMWRAVQLEKEAREDAYNLNHGLRAAFLIFVIANLIYYIFYYLLHTWIDPALVDLQREVMRESLERAGNALPAQQREEMRQSLEGDALVPNLGKVVFTYARSLIGGFVLSLGLAALGNR